MTVLAPVQKTVRWRELTW